MLTYKLINVDKDVAAKYFNKNTYVYIGFYQDGQRAKVIVKGTEEIIGDIAQQDIERLKSSGNISGHLSVRKQLDNNGEMQYYCNYYHDEEFKSIEDELNDRKEMKKSNTLIIVAFAISFLVIAWITISVIRMLNSWKETNICQKKLEILLFQYY